MRTGALVLACITTGGLLLAVTPEGASAKCNTANAPGIALIVDQKVVGIFPADDGNAQLNAATSAYEAESIWSIALICHEEPNSMGDGVVRRLALTITTTEGIVSQGEAWLGEVSAAQADFRREYGQFAVNFLELRASLPTRLRTILSLTTVSSPPHPNEFSMAGSELGWSATFEPTGAGTGTVCRVYGGNVAPPHPGLIRDVPRCFVTGQPAPRTSPSTPFQIRSSQ